MNQVSPFKNRPQRSLVADAASGLGGVRPPSISRNGNKFTLIDGAGNKQPVALIDKDGNLYIDVVIVDANPHKSQVYYEGPYREDNTNPPICWSDNGTGPSIQSSEPQAKTCAVCRHHPWGTGPDGKPACRQSKKVAVIVVGDPTDLVYEFVVPPGSWSGKRGWTNYLATVKQNNMDVSDIVTRVSFVSQGTLAFDALSPVANDEELVARCDDAWASGECPAACGLLDVARDPALPLETKPAASAAPQGRLVDQPSIPPPPRPVPYSQKVDELVQSAPQKRRGRPPKGSPVSENGKGAPEVPPFLQKPPAAISGPQEHPGVVLTPQNVKTVNPDSMRFGMQTPEDMPPEIKDTLTAAFNLKTE